MAISKRTKQPRGYEAQDIKFLAIADGVQPPLEAMAAPYLPVVEEDKLLESWFTVWAGQIVAFDRTNFGAETKNETNKKWLVPANGGTAATVTYTADDIGEVIDIDAYEAGDATPVVGAGAASKSIAANFPAGFAPYNFFNSATPLIYRNFELQSKVGFLTDFFIEVPLLHDQTSGASVVAGQNQSTLDTGELVQAGVLGFPVFWNPATDSVDQICGRCVRIDAISAIDALDKVITVPGLNLPGTGTSGRQVHENVYLYGSTTTKVVYKAKINITLL